MAAGTSKPRLVIDRVLCVSDSERALRLLQTPGRRKNKALKQIFRLLREAAEQRLGIQFTWVPTHSGLQGNEMAHGLPHWSTNLGRIPIDRKIHTPRTLEARPTTSRVETSSASQHLRQLDKALPGNHTRKLYNKYKSKRGCTTYPTSHKLLRD